MTTRFSEVNTSIGETNGRVKAVQEQVTELETSVEVFQTDWAAL
jgi:hypothetical protein